MVVTRQIEFSLPSLSLSLEIVDNVEDLVNDPEDDDQIPYWAELWPASRGLAQYIWESVDFAGAAVLELGAGLGLPGLVAALKGGRVTLTDYKTDALEIAAKNASRNGIPGVSCLLADWRVFPDIEQFDWITGSDVLYNPISNSFVAQILVRNLAPDGQLLFAHPGRAVTFDFLREIAATLELREKRSIVSVHVDDSILPDFEVNIHHLYR